MNALRLSVALFALLAVSCAEFEVQDSKRAGGNGDVSLEWILLDGDEELSCVEAGATELVITSYWADDMAEHRLSCFGGFGEVGPLAAGRHAVEVTLLDPEGDPLVSADLGVIEVQSGSTTPLGAVELALRP